MSAPEIEEIIEDTLRQKLDEQDAPTDAIWDRIERAVVGAKSVPRVHDAEDPRGARERVARDEGLAGSHPRHDGPRA